ncbi:unnamed protein product [Cyprideis torosa]|uniref:Endonuclease/exonuclease/phosphatase domain-containing protein n=1 Tax=Cyprideis torosa TaxID=163714 RepID=A0A7R8ZKN4_9CRUS|nr:unnamed protein product [Cyprideis torosa]CAG0880599.1 unnamed protein product [Cyprideis torosa]
MSFSVIVSSLLLFMVTIDYPKCDGAGLTIKQPLRIGTWNIQNFGNTKLGKPDVMDKILNILSSYDLIAIQEISDSQLELDGNLLNSLNAYIKQTIGGYLNVTSPRIGSGSEAEQYLILYRIVLQGNTLNSSLIEGSVLVRRYDEEMNLTYDQSLDISDHFPVEFQLKPHVRTPYGLDTFVTTMVHDSTVSVGDIYNAFADNSNDDYVVELFYGSSGSVVEVTVKPSISYRTSIEKTLEDIRQLHGYFPTLLTTNMFIGIKYKLENGALEDASAVTNSMKRIPYNVILRCNPSVGGCSLTVLRETTFA